MVFRISNRVYNDELIFFDSFIKKVILENKSLTFKRLTKFFGSHKSRMHSIWAILRLQ